ncbi:MAG: branched-chain amino acid ABC transporter permease [Actinobacteria bacterium]|nr:branched-chain amino acid ABC transporter permease [Actinomycetota bacterium]
MTALIQHAIDAVSLGSLYALLALGVAMIFGIMNLLNFAYGELIMIGAYSLYVSRDLPWPVQLAVCLIVVIAASLAMDRLAFRPFRGASAPVLLVTSFALSFALQSLATVIFGSRAKGVSLPSFFDESITIGSVSFSSLNLVTVVLVIVLVGGLATFLRQTTVGVQMRAAAENFTTARLVGVKADRVIAVAFALSGFSAAVAAILIVAQRGTATPTLGVSPVLIAFVATIIGGLGSLYGAAFGGMLLGVLTVVLQVVLPDSLAPYREAFLYAGVIVVLLARPQGLVVVKALFERV